MAKGPLQQYLFRDPVTGKMLGNGMGHSTRGAMARFILGKGYEPGMKIEVKPRGAGEWEIFSLTR